MELSRPNLMLFHMINGSNHSLLDAVLYAVTFLGSGWVVIPVVLVLYKLDRRRILPVMTAYMLSSLIAQIIKNVWSVPRPAALLDNIHIVGETLKSSSFPSGHTATAFALFYVLTRGLSAAPRASLFSLALCVGYSRVYVGAHFPFDIAGGMLAGLISGYVAVRHEGFFRERWKELIVLFLVPFVVFFYGLNELPFFIVDEARNAEAAREMLERSDFIVPTYNYVLRTDKPPLHYWFFISSYKLFGVSELASRLWSAFIGILMAQLIFRFARKTLGRETALAASMIFTTALYAYLLFRMAVPDPFLIIFSTSALFAYYTGGMGRNPRHVLLFYALLALATLTKGPVGFVLPMGVVVSFEFLRAAMDEGEGRGIGRFFSEGIKSFRIFLGKEHIAGYLIVAAIAVPWYVAVSIKTGGEFTSGFFLHHNLKRFTTSLEGPKGPFIITILWLFAGFFPWSFFLVQTAAGAYRQRKDPLVLFLSLWALIHIVLYSASATKLPHYLVPIYPALAILMARHFGQGMKGMKISAGLIGLFGLGVSIGLGVMGRQYTPDLMPWIALLGLPLLIGGIASAIYERHLPLIIASAMLLFILSLSGWIAPEADRFFMPKKIASAVSAEAGARGGGWTGPVYSYKYYDPAFEFYIRKKIVRTDAAETAALQPGAVLVTTEEDISGVDLRYDRLFSHRDILRKNRNVLVLRIAARQ